VSKELYLVHTEMGGLPLAQEHPLQGFKSAFLPFHHRSVAAELEAFGFKRALTLFPDRAHLPLLKR
jgi:hypothetical protein